MKQRQERKDFKKWLLGEPDWPEIAYLINTGKDYQHKQDLIAVFWNSYIYYQQKFEKYYQEFGIIPYDIFNDLVFKFRQNFPKNGRLEGVNYFDDLIEMLIQKYEGNTNNKEDIQPQQLGTKTEQETIELKPALKPEAVKFVFDIIKDFFSTEQQTELKQILKTGNKASNKLLFKGSGNRLTDTFKKLIEHDFITGCQKQDLINWIISNFQYTKGNIVKDFVFDTVEKTISRNFYPCQSPLIEINNGQIQKVEQPRIKKYSKY